MQPQETGSTIMTVAADTPKTLQPVPGIWVRQEIDNLAWVDLGPDVLVVDALEQAACGPAVLAAIAETTGGKPVRTVVNTHTHHDHVALNGLFVERFGAEIVNARTRSLPATGLNLGSASRPVWVRPMPDCHTPEDCIVHLPDDGVLFVGDIFGWGLIPWDRPLDRAKADHILATYARLVALRAAVVVPGHGPLCGTGELARWAAYFTELIAAVQAARADGATRREIRGEGIAPPADMASWWRFLQWKHEDSVKKVSQAIVRGAL